MLPLWVSEQIERAFKIETSKRSMDQFLGMTTTGAAKFNNLLAKMKLRIGKFQKKSIFFG